MISIVVLDGSNVLIENESVEPLRYALREVVKPEDQVIVLVIFNSGDLQHSPVISSCCIATDGKNHQPSEKERYIRILREEISRGTEEYMKIFRPFYKECKNIGVKFMVKIVAGSTMDAIISEERVNTGATSFIIGRSFAFENAQTKSQKQRILSLQNSSNNEEVLVYNSSKPQSDIPESSKSAQNTIYSAEKKSLFKKKSSSSNQKVIYCTLPNFEGIYQPSSSSSSIEESESSDQETEDRERFEDAVSCFFVEFSWEVVSEITDRFMNIIQHVDSIEAFQMYSGCLEGRGSAVFVKKFVGTESRYVLEAEKKAASSMCHKNVLGLIGFHMNETAMALVFPFGSRGTLMDRFLNGFWAKEFKFHVKMDIAIGIAEGLRYMHELCPQGPIVHCDLRPCNILLGNNLRPQITGFGHAKWLQFEQSSFIRNSCGHMHPSDPASLELIKADILAFGILLLRLFCNRIAPRDDKHFLTWARPLLSKRAYHILYDESEHDVHGLLVVTTAAARCISSREKSRPCMSKVLSFLKGETSCAEQVFPSTESSPNMSSIPDSYIWEI